MVGGVAVDGGAADAVGLLLSGCRRLVRSSDSEEGDGSQEIRP